MTKAAFRNAHGRAAGDRRLDQRRWSISPPSPAALGIAIDLEEFDAIGREVPVLVDLKPSGEHYMEHFHWAGGVPRLLRELGDLLDLDAHDRRRRDACATSSTRAEMCRARR